MRGGESLIPMTPAHFCRAGPDFSAEICTPAQLDDLDPAAVETATLAAQVTRSGHLAEPLHGIRRRGLERRQSARLRSLVNQRNDRQHFQRFFVWDVPTFNERVVRETVLNAVSHRDYRHGGSVFVRQYPQRIEIVSPGGFPSGHAAGSRGNAGAG